MTRTDFFFGVAVTVSAVAVYKICHFLQEPSIEDMEARASASMAEKSGDDSIITVFGFDAAGAHSASAKGVLDASPFVMYVELYCRMIGQPYTKVGCIAAESRFRPRNKLPVANVCGVMLDDSTKIIEAIQKHAGTKKDLDAGLDEEQRAIAKLVGNTLSQSLFWSMLYNKFNTHRGRDVFRRQLSDLKIFAPLRPVISALAFRQMHAQLIGQGIARYPRVQVIERALEDIAALCQILGSKPFILGDRPSSVDALLYAMLVLVFEDHELQADLSSTKDIYPNLAAYVERMKKRYVPELDLSNTTTNTGS
eukprot:scaffold132490_cov55-Attheya_sp.AAC.1